MNQRLKPALLASLFVTATSLFARPALAQEQIPFINSGEVLQEALKKHEDGQYKEALKAYQSIPEGDTNYRLALSEQVLSYLADTNYAMAISVAREALRDNDQEHRRQFTLLLGHAYDYSGKTDSALACYESLIARNPYDYQPWYEKGALYVRAKNYDSAMECFRHSLTLNPFHFRSHYMVGSILALQGRPSEAYLALSTSLFTSSDEASAKTVIRYLGNIADQNDEVATAYRNRKPGATPAAWEEIDEIVASKLPMSKDYTFKSDLAGDGVVNVLHAIMEKVRYTSADTSLVMQYYVPLYNRLFDTQMFDPMVLYMFTGYNINKVEALAKRNKSDVKEARATVIDYLNNIAGTGVIPYHQRQKTNEQYVIVPGNGIFIKGSVKTREPLVFNAGKLVLYKEGELAAEGQYDEQGKKDGTWHYYNTNGNLRSKEQYLHGAPVGINVFYRKNGVISSESIYNSKGEQTAEKEYNANGILSSVAEIHGDQRTITSYHPNGAKEYVIAVAGKNIKDGHYQYFYDDGSVQSDMTIRNGQRDGLYKEYFRNGQLSEESNYVKGKREGKCITYFKNGKLHYNTNYNNDQLEGPYEEWTDLGVLELKGAFHRGKRDGADSVYDHHGKAYGFITYEDDVPVAYEYRDEQGKITGSGKKPKLLVSYHPNGNKRSEVPYVDGKVEGMVKVYYATGNLRRTAHYKAGVQEGEETVYTRFGEVTSRTPYHEGTSDGYYQGFYGNGTPKAFGWMKAGSKQGLWRYYSTTGKLERECYYMSDRLNGPSHSYLESGKRDYTDLYDNGMIVGVIEYDTAGLERRREYYPQGNGNYRMTAFNGKTRYEAPLKHGEYEGQLIRTLPNGALLEKSWISRGVRDSTQEVYDMVGKLYCSGRYKRGLREGQVVYHSITGTVTNEETFVENEQEGPNKVYEDGMLRIVYNYHHDNIEGTKTLYGDNNLEVCVLHFEDDELVAYTATGKDGKMGALIPVKNGTCAITAYYPNGNKAVELSYKDGLLNARQTIYYSNGQLASDRTYEKSEVQGPVKRFYPDGKPSYEAYYVNGEASGKEVIYDKTGKAVATVNYLPGGTRHGEALYLHPDTGKPVRVAYYYGVPTAVN